VTPVRTTGILSAKRRNNRALYFSITVTAEEGSHVRDPASLKGLVRDFYAVDTLAKTDVREDQVHTVYWDSDEEPQHHVGHGRHRAQAIYPKEWPQ